VWQDQQENGTGKISGVIKERCSEIEGQHKVSKTFEKVLLVSYQDTKHR
jgi:hypothetical protein